MLNVTMYDSFGVQISYMVQWDANQTVAFEGVNLSTDTAPIVHFCNRNSDKALGVQSSLENDMIVVKIPNILLKEAETIIAYFYSANRTIEITKIPVRPKPQPNDYFYSDNVEIIALSDLIEQVKKLNSTITLNETNRQDNEDIRKVNESQRIDSEAERKSNETIRQINEVNRQNTSTETIQKCLDTLAKVKSTVDALESSYSKVSASEANITEIENNIKSVQTAINETKNEIDIMVRDYLISETQIMLNEIKGYLEEIQNAKIGLSLNVSAGDAYSFDVQNIMGGNAVTIDNYKFDTGNATSMDD